MEKDSQMSASSETKTKRKSRSKRVLGENTRIIQCGSSMSAPATRITVRIRDNNNRFYDAYEDGYQQY